MPGDAFAITSTSAYGRMLVALSGELDITAVDALRSALAAAADGGGVTVEVDMSEVTFIDSSSLGCLIAAHKRLAADGKRLVVVDPSDCVSKLLKLTGQLERFTDSP